MKKLEISLEALYDLLKEGETEFYQRDLYSTVKIRVRNEDYIRDRDEEDRNFYLISLTKTSVMKLVRNQSFELDGYFLTPEN